MAFACWYSLSVNLPDARVSLAVKRSVRGDYFAWAQRCGVTVHYHKDMPGEAKLWQAQVAGVQPPCIILDPDVLAVRELTPEILALQNNCQASNNKVWFLKDSIGKPLQTASCLCIMPDTEDFSTFVSYEKGWGKFVTADCINRNDYPFRRPDRFSSGEQMSLNELRIMELWKRMDRVFSVVAR